MKHSATFIVILGLCVCAVPASAQNAGGARKPATSSAIAEKLPAAQAPASARALAHGSIPNPATPPARRFLKDDSTLLKIGLRPRTPRTVPAGANNTVRTAAIIWNRYGGLLQVLSARVGVDPEMAVAVVAAESGGRAAADHRLVIRFEVHCFWDDWGHRQPQRFDRHFSFQSEGARRSAGARWKRHQFRTSPSGTFQFVHVDRPAREWEVYEFAEGLHRISAIRSTSWGLGQIMGFNAGRAGYLSPAAMVDEFKDERTGTHLQLISIFDYLTGGRQDSPALHAFRRRDWRAVAQAYNGSNVKEYAQLMESYYTAARQLRGR